jgi:hypothetical protein
MLWLTNLIILLVERNLWHNPFEIFGQLGYVTLSEFAFDKIQLRSFVFVKPSAYIMAVN